MKLVLALLLTTQLALFPNPPISKWHGSLRRVVEAFTWTGVGAVLVGSMWLYSHRNPIPPEITREAHRATVSADRQKALAKQIDLFLLNSGLPQKQRISMRQELMGIFLLHHRNTPKISPRTEEILKSHGTMGW